LSTSRPNLTDTCIVAFSGSLVALGCFNLASDARADALNDWRRFAPTHVGVEGKTIFPGIPGEPERYRVREVDGLIRWDTSDACEENSRLYNFCSGKSSVFEFEVWLSNYQTIDPYEYNWAHHNYDYATNLPKTNYLDTAAEDPTEEFGMTVGTLSARDIQAWTDYYTVVKSEPWSEGPNWIKVRVAVGNNDLKRFHCPNPFFPTAEYCMKDERDSAVAIPYCYNYTFPGAWSWDYEWVDSLFRCGEED